MEGTQFVECDIVQKIELILAEQVTRLLASDMMTSKSASESMLKLSESRLLPKQIEEDLCKELRNISLLRYTDALQGSTRKNGFGWSENHMKEHMRRLLKTKLSAIEFILRSYLN
jgi:hypothetical protein